jgi:menaquinone-dependent protoporphyrinogen IX oxidase
MPRSKKILIVNESIEKDPESPKDLGETQDSEQQDSEQQDSELQDFKPKPIKEKKPRTEKQIAAFAKALEIRKAKAEAKKTETVIPKEIELPEIQSESKKRGRPALSVEKLEEKATLKEIALQTQLNKLQKKLDMAAKKEAKKQMLEKLKSKLNEEGEDIDTDDDNEINEIIKKQKKPIVILNKIDNGKVKRQPIPQPTAIFV